MNYKTYEELLNIGLEAVPSGYDKTENSFIYGAISAAALIGHEMMLNLQEVENQLDAENWYGGGMDSRVYDRTGLVRYAATSTTATVTFSGDVGTYVPQGFVVSNGTYEFTTDWGAEIEEDGTVDIDVTATISGDIGSIPAGNIDRAKNGLVGLRTVTNKAAAVGGRDVETDAEFLARYYNYFTGQPVNNNPSEFRAWAMEVDGVGQARVIRADKVAGEVTVIVTDANYQAADAALVEKVYEAITEKMGFDVTLTVLPAKEKKINLTIEAVLDDASQAEALSEAVRTAIEADLRNYPDRNFIKKNISLYALVAIAQKQLSEIVDVVWDIEGTIMALADDEVPMIESVEVVASE